MMRLGCSGSTADPDVLFRDAISFGFALKAVQGWFKGSIRGFRVD
jgi:hypothetical protein